jgi:opacity protein-like surface antigen
MRFAVLAALLVLWTPGFTPVAFAGDDEEEEAEEEEEEGGEDVDELMTKDPESEKKPDEAGEGEEEALEQLGDEERPPGEEPSAPEPEPTAEAEAESGGRENPFSVGLLFGYGISLEPGLNVWGVGFGLGAGYNVDDLYVGARFAYYIGESETMERPNFGVSMADVVDISENVWELGAEIGYDLHASSDVVIRPGLGLGLASTTFSTDGGTGISETFAYFAPGVGLFYNVSESIYLGVEARFQLVLSNPATKALIPFAGLGMHF